MELKPCPYRKVHEWEWEAARQGWLCAHCYAFTSKRDELPLVPPIAQDDSTKPTPPFPFPVVKASHRKGRP